MQRRSSRRLTLTMLTAVSMIGSLLAVAGPATAATPAARIVGVGLVQTSGTPLSMRGGPTSASGRVGTIASGQPVAIVCYSLGELVTGSVKTNRVWLRLSDASYVSDAYVVRTYFPIPQCPPVAVLPPPTNPGLWVLPVSAGLVSGFHTVSRPNHDGVDLGAKRNTPIRSAAAGTVIRVVCNVSTNNCDVDGNRTLKGCGWYAEVEHIGHVVTRYCHMVRRPVVYVGQVVTKGQLLGYVGTSGSSSGPHLHFEVHTGNPATRVNAVSPITFMRIRGLLIS